MRKLTVYFLFALCTAGQAFAQSTTTLNAATQFAPQIQWKPESAQTGDFSCNNQHEFAMLGTSNGEIAVAIFTNSLSNPPKLIRYTADNLDAANAQLSTESLNFNIDQQMRQWGFVPEGLIASKTCKGLVVMAHEEIEPVHIYWNQLTQQFEDWSF
jgi:hypothetical protein